MTKKALSRTMEAGTGFRSAAKNGMEKTARGKARGALFITIEGLEGSGKSSIIGFLQKFLKEKGYSIKVFREPGSTKIGEKIRAMLLNKKNRELSVHTVLLLYLAARTQLIEEKLRDALKQYDFVICDRFFDSTLVYQGVALGLKKVAESAVKMFYLGIEPDLTILLDAPPQMGLARIKNKDRIEQRPIEFHRKLREGYLQLAKCFRQRIKVVDARGTLCDIYPKVEKVLISFLKKHQNLYNSRDVFTTARKMQKLFLHP